MEDFWVSTQRLCLESADKTYEIFSTEIAFVESTRTEAHYQVAGLDEETSEIGELINATFKSSSTNGFTHNKSVLLYGNTGTGKTTLAKFIAHTLRVNVAEISATFLYGKNSKSPEETVNELFQNAIDKSPSVILLDEIDLLCPSRNGEDIFTGAVSYLTFLL